MRPMWKPMLVCVLVASLLLPLPARAEHTRFWRQSNYDEFEKGTAEGVALRSDGKLALAPRFAQLADPNMAYLWSLRVDSKGILYTAGGSNAKVLRFDEKGNGTTVFESQEMAAQALALDAHDNLYVGTSPDGKVYRIAPGSQAGKATVFFEPKTKYIWDLAVDKDGTVYVATGDKGEVFAVTPDGKGQVFYKSEERHARSLAFDAQGYLLVGTDPNGLIVRVAKSTQASQGSSEKDRGFVLYETSKKEVTALLADRAGNIYAAAMGEKPRPPMPTQVPVTVPPPTIISSGQQPGVTLTPTLLPQPAIPFPLPTVTGGSEVYRIAPDGAPEQLWSSREELVYALGFSPSGKLLLGTGNRGLIIELEGNNIFSSLAKTASSQVTGLAQGPGNRVYLCTANPGKVFTLGPEYQSEGSFVSQTFDAKIFSQWGRLSWWGENGAMQGQVSFYVRSGNTSNPANDWSPWSGPYTDFKGEKVTCPPARFVQWKAVFKSQPGESPNISWISLAYLPKNVLPTIDHIIVQNPGIRVQGFPAPQPGAGAPQSVQLRLPPPTATPPTGGPTQQPSQPPKFEPPPQGFVQKGAQAVLWSARDDNDDDLEFAIYYRGEGEKNWKLLKDKLEQKFYSWDASSMPDGAYSLKIVASDAPSNPPGEALTAERESDRFEVDNTPPVVEGLRADITNPEVRVSFQARDSYSPIARTEYSLDAGDWKLVFPVDRVTDSLAESYQIMLRELAPGEHTLAVRAYDQFENSSSAKVTFTVLPRKR